MTEKKSREEQTPKKMGGSNGIHGVDTSILTDKNVIFVRDLVDTLQRPPYVLTQAYLDAISRCASFFDIPLNMGGPSGTKVMWTDQTLPEQTYTGGSPLLVGPDVDAQEKARNETNRLRIAVFGIMNQANLFVAQAKNSGFAPPANPFARAMQYNVGRTGFNSISITIPEAVEIVTGIRQYVALLAAQASGQINFSADPTHAAQLSSVRLSLEGFGGSGDTVVDLARLLPDIDAVKAQKALDALSSFDFSKRTPKMLFTAEYAPQDVPSGIIVAWKKVADASGYIVRRKSLFDKKEETFVMDNVQTKSSSDRLAQYVGNWILGFYDSLNPRQVCSFLDVSVPKHSFVTYQVQAYQMQNTSPGAIFDVETTPFFMSQALKTQIRNQLESLDPNGRNGNTADTISPYPVLAHFILGDAKNDWILAAINSRQSANRRDAKIITRGYSYLAAQLQFLFAQADAGKLLIPKNRDVTAVKNKISDSIVQYGVNQVIKELLEQTGALYYFEGKDISSNELLSQNTTGGLVSSVASAIDPENAVLNTKALGSNLMKLLSGEYVDNRDVVGSKGNPNSREIAVTAQDSDRTTSKTSEDGIKVLNQIVAESGMIDLTTFEGLSSFMRIVRIFSDVGPNRGAPLVETPEQIIPDPVQLPAPAPAPRSSTQPVEEPIQELSDTQPALDARAEEERKKKENEAALAELKKVWENGAPANFNDGKKKGKT